MVRNKFVGLFLNLQTSKRIIADFDFSKDNPQIGAICDGSLQILDFRESLSAPAQLYKQTTTSTLLRWNPLVPYWIATSDASSLHIFDIRYNGSMPMRSIPHVGVNQLAWSPTHCDLLLAASKDRRMNLWSLSGDESHCRLNTMSLDYELESLIAGDGNTFHALNVNDSIIRIELNAKYLASLAPLQSDDPQVQQLQRALYQQDSSEVTQRLLQASRSETYSASFRQVKQLLLQSLHDPKSPHLNLNLIGSLTFDSNCQKDFNELVNESTATTQRLFIRRKSEPGSDLQEFFEQLRLKVRVVELIAANDAESITKLASPLIDAFTHDSNFLTSEQSMVRPRIFSFLFVFRNC